MAATTSLIAQPPVKIESALDGLLRHAVVYEDLAGHVSPGLFRASFVADGTLVAVAVVSQVITGDAIRQSHLFWPVAEDIAAALADLLAFASVPAISIALVGAALKLAFRSRRAPPLVHAASEVEVMAAIGSSTICGLIATIFVLGVVVAIVLAIVIGIIAILLGIGLLFGVLAAVAGTE